MTGAFLLLVLLPVLLPVADALAAKVCPEDQTEFPDNWSMCPVHAVALVEQSDRKVYLLLKDGTHQEAKFTDFGAESCKGYAVRGVAYSAGDVSITIPWKDIQFIIPPFGRGRLQSSTEFSSDDLRTEACPQAGVVVVRHRKVKVLDYEKDVSEEDRITLNEINAIAFDAQGLEAAIKDYEELAALVKASARQSAPAPASPATPVSAEPAASARNRKGEPEGMVLVKGGCYRMGDIFGKGEEDELPVHEVCVNDFYVDRHEVTVGQFREFVRQTGYRTEAQTSGKGCRYFTGAKWEWGRDKSWESPGYEQDDTHPVVCVSWNDARQYLQWRSRREGRTFRFLTEAEWEYAARSGGKKYLYSWGNGSPAANIADESARRVISGLTIWRGYNDGYVYTAPVGSFAPNELGLYDMTGNVWEWVGDWYGEEYYKDSPRDNPQGPDTGKEHVLRGGSWGNYSTTRTSYRFSDFLSFWNYFYGFRCASTP